MSNGAGGAVTAAAVAAAAIAKAIKASGVIVRISPEDFQSLVANAKGSLVVHSEGGLFTTKYKYLLGYKGFAFFTKSSQAIPLPGHVEAVRAAKIWVPD